MQQYLKLLSDIKEQGTLKPAARENMPSTQSLFGYQFRHDLSKGFPLLTTKEMYWKGVVIELLWFLRGDTNIKYLINNGVNIWNEDAYQFYLKQIGRKEDGTYDLEPMSFETFVERVKDDKNYEKSRVESVAYKLGDCGFQYGKVWRHWRGFQDFSRGDIQDVLVFEIDQIKMLIGGLKNNPESRRHMLTALDPANYDNLALFPCHTTVQFNCRPIPVNVDDLSAPQYYLDCQLYQRSADVFLGVPFNIASYALLTEIFAKMCNMIAGVFVHTFGDVHIYDTHSSSVDEQLSRTPTILPKLKINECSEINWQTSDIDVILKSIDGFELKTFELNNYKPQSKIKGILSTGLK